MFMKRAMYSWRNWKMVAAQFLVPLIFTAFALIVAKTFPGPRDSSMLRLTLEPYGQTIVPFSVPTASGLPQRLAEQYVELLDAQHQSPLEVPGEALQSTHVVLSAGFSCQGWVPSDIPYGIISCTGVTTAGSCPSSPGQSCVLCSTVFVATVRAGWASRAGAAGVFSSWPQSPAIARSPLITAVVFCRWSGGVPHLESVRGGGSLQ